MQLRKSILADLCISYAISFVLNRVTFSREIKGGGDKTYPGLHFKRDHAHAFRFNNSSTHFLEGNSVWGPRGVNLRWSMKGQCFVATGQDVEQEIEGN